MSYFGKISAKEHYGLRLAIWLGTTFRTKKPITLAEISRHEKISVKFLEQLVRPFRQAGLVKSTRGRSGGYILTKNPKLVSLKDILDMLTDRSRVVECLADGQTRCPLEKRCPSKVAWQKVQKELDKTLSKIKISQLI